jgi:hypothetical protein
MDDIDDRPQRISDNAIRNAEKGGRVLQNLLDVADPDWTAWQADDPEFFMRAAGREIRKFLGWNLFPNIRQDAKVRIGAQGIIMLPSRHVTEVDRLALTFGAGHEQEIAAGSFTWHEQGYIELNGPNYWLDWYSAGYGYGSDQYYLPTTQPGVATVTFWHGHHALPEDVKIIAYELAQQAMVMSHGNVKQLATPGEFKIELTQNAGLTLNADQRDRLSSHRIGMIG